MAEIFKIKLGLFSYSVDYDPTVLETLTKNFEKNSTPKQKAISKHAQKGNGQEQPQQQPTSIASRATPKKLTTKQRQAARKAKEEATY